MGLCGPPRVRRTPPLAVSRRVRRSLRRHPPRFQGLVKRWHPIQRTHRPVGGAGPTCSISLVGSADGKSQRTRRARDVPSNIAAAMGTIERPRVAFVTYEASRTGSPLLLLRLLRWIRVEAAIDAEVVCWRGGPLVGALRAVADVRVLAPGDRRTVVEAAAVVAGEVGHASLGRRIDDLRLAFALRGRPEPDLVYLNGVPSFVALPHLRAGDCPVLGHVHELEFALRRSLPVDCAGLLQRPDRYLAVSAAVADNLVGRHDVDRARVAVHHGFVDDALAVPAAGADGLRRSLGIPDDAPVVGAMGDVIWRKGPDLFLAMAAALVGTDTGRPAPHFVWVGGAPGRGAWRETVADLDQRGLGDHVHLVAEQEQPADWYHLFDLFVLTSREDPFPLVALEAAQAGCPIVAFDQGGVPELLVPPGEIPAGVLVPALDVEAMADAVAALLAEPTRGAALGEAGAARVAERHTTSVAAPRLLAEIEAMT